MVEFFFDFTKVLCSQKTVKSMQAIVCFNESVSIIQAASLLLGRGSLLTTESLVVNTAPKGARAKRN